MRKLQAYVPMAVLIVSCLAYLYWLLGEVVLHPNSFIIMNNTDGRQILFNTYFHTRFGSGLTLSNQLFPNFDVLFMTDAQASVSVLLNALQTIGIPVLPYVVGITNGLILYSIPLAALMLFASARLLGIRSWMSVWGAFFITALSPQWLRVVCGHAGLAYLIYIPALIYAVLYWASPKKKSGLVFLLTLFLVLFIGFNNGYMLLSGIAFLSLFNVVHLVQTRQWRIKVVWYPLVLVCIAGLGLGIIKKLSDPVHDRESAPYGFLVYHAIPESVLLPSHGVVLETLNKLLPIPVEQGQEEGAAYIGLFALLVLIASAFYFVVRYIRKRTFKLSSNKALNSLLITALLLLVYAMALPFRWGLEGLLDVFPFIKQFRSPGRFAWLFYYVFSLYALYRFELWRRCKGSSRWLVYGLILFFTVTYAFDIQGLQTWNMRYIKAGGYTKNYFQASCETGSAWQQVGIDTTHIAAVLGLPLNCAWNSKFERGDEYYNITQQLVEFSSATGIPWLTAKLSRASTLNTLRSGQWVSNPLITREGLMHWPQGKDLLLIHEKKYILNIGEHDLVSQGQLIKQDSLFDYYRIPISLAIHRYRDSVRNTFDSVYQRSTINQYRTAQHVYWSNFTTRWQSSPAHDTTIVETYIKPLPNDANMECAVWVAIDATVDNMPNLKLQWLANPQTVEAEMRIGVHEATDYQDGYLRYPCNFTLPPEGKLIKVILEKGSGHIVTRCMIRPKNLPVYLFENQQKSVNGYFLYSQAR